MGNFWGDMDGDGQETPWDDMLGDGLMYEYLEAKRREANGEPPEPDDEDLLGYRRRGPYNAAPAYAGGANAWVVTLVLLGIGVVFVCVLLGGMR